MKSIKDFQKVEMTNKKNIYGGGKKTTRESDGSTDRWKSNGDLKTNVDWNPFNNDTIKVGY